MKKFYLALVMALCALGIQAQWQGWPQGGQQGRPQGQQGRPQAGQQGAQQRFSPEKFDADMQDFITKEANLTPQEASKFFPVYKEMQEKQRVLFMRQSQVARTKPADEQGCLKAIKESDDIDLELKNIQKTYHKRFLDLLPASKVYDILQAEQRFYRHTMRSWGRGNGNTNGNGRRQQQFPRFPQFPQFNQGQGSGMPQMPQRRGQN
ncbi:MAG: hypothetical protein J5552_11035 [Prevotella sp.]|nr:hypothetical protein [Prevotella sp.]